MSIWAQFRKRQLSSSSSEESDRHSSVLRPSPPPTTTAGLPAGGRDEAGGAPSPSLSEDDGAATRTLAPSSSSCAPSFSAMRVHKNPPAKTIPQNLESEEAEYIRDNCLVPNENLKTFADIIVDQSVMNFAENYQPVAQGALRPVSGLLLFGPPGTGKSSSAQAIASFLGATYYKFSAADLPNGKAGAKMIDALFDVAMAGELPAVIFIDEVDTILGARAPARVGHFANRFERFKDNLLVIGATNEPQLIAPKILAGRFERKILIDTPNYEARQTLILKQLGQEEEPHALSSLDLYKIIDATAGRSAVNLERLVSTAVMRALGQPVAFENFEQALEEEPSDFDLKVATQHAKYDRKFGWHG